GGSYFSHVTYCEIIYQFKHKPMHKSFGFRLILLMGMVAILAASTNPDQKKITLSLNLEKGDSFQIEMMANQDINQVIMGVENNIQQTQGYIYTYDVEDIVDGNYDIEVTYDAIIFNQSTQGMTTEYDSRDTVAEVPLTAQGFAGLVGQSFQMTMASDGSVKEISGMDQMIDNMIDQMEVPGLPKEQLRDQLKTQMGNESMKGNMAQMVAAYPDKPIKVGNSWTNQSTVRTTMTLVEETTYTLNKVDDGKAYIGVEGTIATDPEGAPMEMMGMSMSFALEGTQKGTMVIDIASGMTLESNINQLISGDVSMSGGQLGDQTMEFPMSIESTNTIKQQE
ncbi:MAG: DUF6263 family protein, partial [Bacteroidota bacterium]